MYLFLSIHLSILLRDVEKRIILNTPTKHLLYNVLLYLFSYW